MGGKANDTQGSTMMKRTFSLIAGILLCASVAHARDVSIKAVLSTEPDGEPTTSFAPDTPKVFALFKTDGIEKGDKLRGVWIAEDVGTAAPANSKIDEKTLELDEDTDDGDFSLSKPTKGWPVGKYRVDFYLNGKLKTSAKFTIGAAGKSEKASDTSAAVPDKAKLNELTEGSVLSFGRAVKSKDFTGFFEKIAALWQKQTSPEKLTVAFQSFLDKDIDLPAALKGLEPIFNFPAEVNADGVLLIKGYYPTKPSRVVFALKYLKEAGEWKLIGIDVNLKE